MDSNQPMASGSAGPAPTAENGAAPTNEVRTGTYELMVIFPATYADEEVVGLREKIAKVLTDHSFKATEQEDLGKRKLAFAINHIRQGFYHLYRFEGPRAKLKELEGALRLTSEILRFLITSRTIRTPEQLKAEAELRERIQAKRMAAEERAVAERHVKQVQQVAAQQKPAAAEPTHEVSKEELEKKLEEILTDETMGE